MDVSHELGALRFVVDSPLSSKVAMFNQQVDQHKQSQLLNPFSNSDGRASPKPTFSKDEYGKPLAGSLTEMRGQKANIHVLKEMLELCQIIDSEGYDVKDEPSMRVIPFGELFNIYNYISDKVVGILLRARKHKLVEFEGEMLFQRRDDDVPIFLIKPVHEIRHEMEDKIDSIKRCGSPAPQATSILLDKKAHGLDVPKGATPRSSVSPTSSPQTSKSGTPIRDTKPKPKSLAAEAQVTLKIEKNEDPLEATGTEVLKHDLNEANKSIDLIQTTNEPIGEQADQAIEIKEATKPVEIEVAALEQQPINGMQRSNSAEMPNETTEIQIDNSNNNNNNKSSSSSNNTTNQLPTIFIESTAVNECPAKIEDTSATKNATPTTPESNNNEEAKASMESTASA